MNTTNELKVLQMLDLTENQAKVYLAILHNPKKTIAEIARILKMDKSSAYRASEELSDSGLILSKTRIRGTTYTATDPQNLKKLYELKKAEIISQGNIIENLIENIRSNKYNLERNTFIRVEKGIDAHKKCMEESLEEFGGLIRERFNMDLPIHDDKEYVNWVKEIYFPKRIKSRIRIRELGKLPLDHDYGDIMETSQRNLKEIRILPDAILDKNDFRVYGNNVEILSFDKTGDHIVVSVKDEFIADLLRNLFDFVWERSKLYTKKKKN